MADNANNNDEYQLDDLDLLASEPEAQLQAEPVEAPPKPSRSVFLERSTLRNGLIALGCVIVLMVCYKIISSVISGNQSLSQAEITPVAPIKRPLVSAPAPFPTPSTQAVMAESPLNQKLTKLENDQNNISTDVLNINNQLSGVTTTVNDIATKMAELNGLIATLNGKIEAQSQEIERLHTIQQHKRATSFHRRARGTAQNTAMAYAIQAVIPGRAWLIARDGSTLTVREGTLIAGYGMVKLIDAKQGRVLTSSGRIIRFSQSDS